jgi:hypothetical protein
MLKDHFGEQITYHNNPILNLNPKTQTRKGLIIYNTTNGIATSRKHVNSYHCTMFLKNLKKLIVL